MGEFAPRLFRLIVSLFDVLARIRFALPQLKRPLPGIL
jgi:hypothetical protein